MQLRTLILLFSVCMCFAEVHAQWDTQISQYWRIKTYYNPSFAGEIDSLHVGGLHRQQWVGIDNAPKATIISADMPFNFLDRKHGVGALVVTESKGLFKNTTMSGQYVYKKKFKKNLLNVGIQLGIANISFDAAGIEIPDSNDHDKGDEGIPGSDADNSSAFDMGLGVSWIAPNYYVGFSATHVMEPNITLDKTRSAYIPRTFYLTGGYNIKLRNPLIELQPSFLVKSDLVATQIDVTARAVYNKMFNGGISWRKDDGFIFLLGVTFRNFDVGYAYDLSTSAISTVSKGTHEFFVRYAMPLNLDKPKKNRRKSVRVL
ncbi:type IX secretion system membrane protein PorP/SprF [Dysgonomonas sp. 520]|uniref:PorP/SprF family type IX secretion system membrane protein n=1 Tax=Dysgonomonas sp. 520 TaxID=2302931 RepID=UPI0013D601B1|nr:type IX secretion system membrane protein PorP/SprF [Dysgonomonas sp. 520]NDW08401.1 type IX secretion system membrane protein PorP/SprF [Dysgonomonas sp. 520]